jgi:hypothetical protein
MEKTESNKKTDTVDRDAKGLIDELKKMGIKDVDEFKEKLFYVLQKKHNEPVLVKDLFPEYKKNKKERNFIKALSDMGLIRPLCGGTWKSDSTIMFTREGRDMARKHNVPVIPLIFVSYSHKDCEWKDLLERHLKVLDQYFHLETWDDNQIPTGKDFKNEIVQALELSDAAILLISADYLSSVFIKNEEIPRIFEDKAKDVFPILLRPCAWKLVKWLSLIQIHLAEDRALSEWTEGKPPSEIIHPAIEKCFASVTEEIANRLSLIKESNEKQ